MKSYEHRVIGQAAAGDAPVNVGGEHGAQRCVLSYGDVVALSGDYFPAEELFRLAAIPGDRGTSPGTRDEVMCALTVMAADEGYVDSRFEPAAEEVERLVRKPLLGLGHLEW